MNTDRDFHKTQAFAVTILALSTADALDLATKIAQLILLLISIAYAIHKWRKSIRKEQQHKSDSNS